MRNCNFWGFLRPLFVVLFMFHNTFILLTMIVGDAIYGKEYKSTYCCLYAYIFDTCTITIRTSFRFRQDVWLKCQKIKHWKHFSYFQMNSFKMFRQNLLLEREKLATNVFFILNARNLTTLSLCCINDLNCRLLGYFWNKFINLEVICFELVTNINGIFQVRHSL